MPVAVITGASRGLGRALATALAERGWDLVLDARTGNVLEDAAREARAYGTRVVALAGDVTDAGHRTELVAAARGLGGLDLLVNNASALGAEPLVRLEELSPEGLRAALETNVVAALGLVREALPLLREAAGRGGEAGAVISVSSDAAVEAYETWGGYGASKAALDQLSAVLAAEEPGLRVWAVDPGDMRTGLYAAAVPDDDAWRPEPAAVVPAFLRLLGERPRRASGRYVASALLGAEGER
ncbi:short-chain dehydrogenase [Streptomyces agglomeratus]|uniref:Short-chain dehydrogenase n=1 Tax=Streptomyces agglomeratus TaxID=285458 RepID=A0A1E5PDT7_9ACTN|nr:SDR family oxidoreductase [Streptomyces agglomeratus]OEJ27554.1 short-chain dehydrogenase [Streptomyces agglomeratus]OEJ38387.1 short-chain dehydrogenase [Streptomyces agglomeratus]OEJ47228.1 short-chain dehydrogenase [Streptomyces agglomeratus]OEJ50915.1 short-chain dehydrogenase [Streptomyces agglomeratus]OEJ58285.1 short-chain dehydrogenase [Streptomyces agglomeratus]